MWWFQKMFPHVFRCTDHPFWNGTACPFSFLSFKFANFVLKAWRRRQFDCDCCLRWFFIFLINCLKMSTQHSLNIWYVVSCMNDTNKNDIHPLKLYKCTASITTSMTAHVFQWCHAENLLLLQLHCSVVGLAAVPQTPSLFSYKGRGRGKINK